jgi:hypothetical protein
MAESRQARLVAETATGPVYAATAKFAFAAPPVAFAMMHEYARRARGCAGAVLFRGHSR